MKQVLQNLKNGEITLAETPMPHLKSGHVLIRSSQSLISIGTERMLLEFGRSNWLSKVKQQPDKVKQVIEKIQTDGVRSTYEAVKNRLDRPLPLGYSNVGTVIGIGDNVHGLKLGDRVVSNGNHAEAVCVPRNLCAKVPENVSDENATFTVVSSIGLQGIRLLEPTLGETHVVIGLGLIGLLSVQILKANGCQVIGLDYDQKKVDLAKSFGASAFKVSEELDPVATVNELTDGKGCDGVLITASTKSNGPIEQAPQMCRKRGKVVLVGVVGLDLSRAHFYEKEISFQVSCSYGPGRYDDNYEKRGLDYPIGHVRWTEQRNFEAILYLMSKGLLDCSKLISINSPLIEVKDLYDKINEGHLDLGVLLKYPTQMEYEGKTVRFKDHPSTAQKSICGIIGAGNFTNMVLLPELNKTEASIKYIASSAGVSGHQLAKKYNISNLTSDYHEILEDKEVNTVFITTPHNTHAKMVMDSLKAGKHVFVEKPLCLTLGELDEISELHKTLPGQQIMVGFNRRFSPLIKKVKELLSQSTGPFSMNMTINAGHIPKDHWTQSEAGGGRLLGEACHFIDLLRHLSDSEIIDSKIVSLDAETNDTFSISLKFQNGSIGTVHYFANGHKSYPKEKLEVFSAGKILILDNFKSLRGVGWKSFKSMRLNSQDKGHEQEFEDFVQTINKGQTALIPFSEIYEVMKKSIELNSEIIKQK